MSSGALFAFDVAAIAIVVIGRYFPRHRRRDLLVAALAIDDHPRLYGGYRHQTIKLDRAIANEREALSDASTLEAEAAAVTAAFPT